MQANSRSVSIKHRHADPQFVKSPLQYRRTDCSMLQPVCRWTHFSNVGQQIELPAVKFSCLTLYTLTLTWFLQLLTHIVDPHCWNVSIWRRPSEGCKMLQYVRRYLDWWLNKVWVHVSVFIDTVIFVHGCEKDKAYSSDPLLFLLPSLVLLHYSLSRLFAVFGSVCFVIWPFVVPLVEYPKYEGWNFNSGNYLFTTDTK